MGACGHYFAFHQHNNPVKLSGGGTPCTLLQNVTGNVSCSFPAINWIDSIFIKTISGTPTIQIGTTLAGSDILPTTPVNDFLYEKTEYPFKTDGALYFVITGGNVNIRINNIPNLI